VMSSDISSNFAIWKVKSSPCLDRRIKMSACSFWSWAGLATGWGIGNGGCFCDFRVLEC
jgi:hypothetical protein